MKWHGWLGIILTGISTIGLVVSVFPVSNHTDLISFSSPSGITGSLQLTQSDQVRLGDTSKISLKINVDQAQVTETPLVFHSKLEMDYLNVTPRGEGTVSVDPTKPVELSWQISPNKAGARSGTLWLFVATGDGEREMILARPMEIIVKTLFGLSFQPIETGSIIGLILGVVLILSALNKQRLV